MGQTLFTNSDQLCPCFSSQGSLQANKQANETKTNPSSLHVAVVIIIIMVSLHERGRETSMLYKVLDIVKCVAGIYVAFLATGLFQERMYVQTHLAPAPVGEGVSFH